MDMEWVLARAKELFLEHKGFPQFFLIEFVDHGIAEVLVQDMPQETATIKKMEYLFYKGRQFAEDMQNKEIHDICFFSEAWLGTDEKISPSSDPKRKEALIISLVEVAKRKITPTTHIFKIIRDGKHVHLVPFELDIREGKNRLTEAFLAGYLSSQVQDKNIQAVISHYFPKK